MMMQVNMKSCDDAGGGFMKPCEDAGGGFL